MILMVITIMKCWCTFVVLSPEFNPCCLVNEKRFLYPIYWKSTCPTFNLALVLSHIELQWQWNSMRTTCVIAMNKSVSANIQPVMHHIWNTTLLEYLSVFRRLTNCKAQSISSCYKWGLMLISYWSKVEYSYQSSRVNPVLVTLL